MSLKMYILHYIKPGQVALMLLTAIIAIGLSLVFIQLAAKQMAKKYTPDTQGLFIADEVISLAERFYELIFSSTSVLMFVGVYFLIDFFGIGASYRNIWNKYNGLVLLGFILASIIFVVIMDKHIIPLNHMHKGEQASMRLLGMIYMLVIFVYIKFIYNDSNYDSIIVYFLSLVFGRFIYFDASLESFTGAVKEALRNLPLLLLALMCTGILALVGFRSGYLLRMNGVVLNLFFGHLYLLVVIFIVHRILPRMRKRAGRSKRSPRARK